MKPIRTFDVIKHERFMDVAFLVTRVHGPFGPNKKLIIHGQWVNQGFIESFPIGVSQKLKLTTDSLKHWLRSADPMAKCLRYVEWKPIV